MSSTSKIRTYGFVTLSILAHIALAYGVIKYNVQKSDDIKEVTEISEIAQVEIEAATSPIEGNQQAGAPTLAEVPSIPEVKSPEASVTAPAPSLPVKTVEAVKTVPTPGLSLPSKPTAAKLPTKSVNTSSSKPVSSSPVPVVAAATPESDTPESEIEESISSTTAAADETSESAPEIADSDEAAPSIADKSASTSSAPVSAPIATPETDRTEDSQNEGQEQEDKAAAADEKKAQEEKLAALQKQQQEKTQKMTQGQEAEPAQEREDLAAAAAENAAKELEAAQAKEAAAAKLAEEAKQAQSPQAIATAVPQSSGSSANSPNKDEVRAIEDLRQIPGNKRPQYEAEDRLQGRQGEVAFMAYVSKEGGLGQFKMLKSSGYRELDAKTLKSLKNWKFYPGQEGWVEIPFKWDLKGGPEEIPAGLRRRAQVSQQP